MIVKGASVIGKVVKKLVRVIDSDHFCFSDLKLLGFSVDGSWDRVVNKVSYIGTIQQKTVYNTYIDKADI